MNKPALDIFQESKALGVTLEQENGGWIAVLSGSNEELGFPAATEEEALDEIRAYRAIDQSSLYKFEYDEQLDTYIVSWGDSNHADKLLAQAYRAAQEAYAASVATPAPAPEPPAPEPAPKARKARAPKTLPGVPEDAPEAVKATAEEVMPSQGTPPWEPLPEAPSKASSTLAFIADLLDDLAVVLRKRGQSQ